MNNTVKEAFSLLLDNVALERDINSEKNKYIDEAAGIVKEALNQMEDLKQLNEKYLEELYRWGYPNTPRHIDEYKKLETEVNILKMKNEKLSEELYFLKGRFSELYKQNQSLEIDLKEEMDNYQDIGRLWHNSETEKEKLIEAIKHEIDILKDKRFTAYICDNQETYNTLDEIVEELEGLIND